VIISQTGFSGEKGSEIYPYDAPQPAEDLWNAVLVAAEKHQLAVLAPSHHRRIAAAIRSSGQDMDQGILPFQVNLAYQGPRKKAAGYIGKAALEAARDALEVGVYPYTHQLVGMIMGGAPIEEYAPVFWLISEAIDAEPTGYVTSPWF